MSLLSLKYALKSIIENLKEDYVVSSGNELVKSIEKVYSNYYAVNSIEHVDERDWFIFVDAGFKPYALDIAVVMPTQIGALVRDSEGKLSLVSQILGKPSTDSIILYTSRRRLRTDFDFRISITPMSSENLLFHDNSVCNRISVDLSAIIREFAGSTGLTRKARFFVRLANYVESLVELSYGLKIYMEIKERLGVESYVVLDGTLIKWFGVEKKIGYDGLDIVSTILETSVSDVKNLLNRVIGLSKTTKFTTIARSYSTFRKALGSMDGEGLYTTVDTSKAIEAVNELKSLINRFALKSFTKEIIKTLCRVVFNQHGVYVARFPITTDGNTVFIMDVYVDKPILKIERNLVELDPNAANEANARLERIIPSLFSKRSRLAGEPPYGYMEVDQIVRLPGKLSRVFEEALISYMRSLRDPELNPLIQAFTTTLRMRYGYGEGY